MEHKWAPWRTPYIQKIESADDGTCIFCTKPQQNKDRDNLLLYRAKTCFVLMNLYPYNNGHLMVVPYEHVKTLEAICGETISEMFDLASYSTQIIEKSFHAEGFNVGFNLGRTAGAGIDQHLHLHIVPRWNGDTNFMPVIGDTKVISQGLYETYEALLPHYQKL